MKKKPFGILGGMGPEASLYFCRVLTKMTAANKDQDHIPYILYNKPEIPDRTESILENKISPLPEMISALKTLDQLSCDFIVIPCNTAHYYFPLLEKEVETPLLSMLEETIISLKSSQKEGIKVGLLATSGTLHTKIYEKALTRKGFAALIPSPELQENIVMPSIELIKKNTPNFDSFKALQPAAKHLIEKGARALILGCTEVSLAFADKESPIPLLDPLQILAKKIIQKYGKKAI